MESISENKITIRKSTHADINDIADIYVKAREFMRKSGNPTQWADGYPTDIDVTRDIENGTGYVGVNRKGDIVMAFAFIVGDDPTYNVIEDGQWLDNELYGTIHRLGSDGTIGGVFQTCVDFCSSIIGNLRLDTHRDNKPMLGAVSKLGFTRCGIIYCRDGSPRIAFQKRF